MAFVADCWGEDESRQSATSACRAIAAIVMIKKQHFKGVFHASLLQMIYAVQ